MSKTIDERVVSMQFDNRQFENNVKNSMSTLDKLKQKLKLTEASKGLENVNNTTKKFSVSNILKGLDNVKNAAKNVDMSQMSNGVETVRAKFSALDVMAATVFSRIANSAIDTGKKLVSAFTIDPIKSGFEEYETQINAVQTILANTSKQGTTLADVNGALKELNTYADKTIYNFTEMTKNIGTFTAAGLDLQTSTKGIQGIANLAAISGSTSQQASTAMYQLSQALSAGTVQLMDWNSVVNAGMGGKVFQDAIIQTGKEMGKLDKGLVKAYEDGASFRSLLDGSSGYGKWFTSDILSTTLSKFTKTGVVEYMAKFANTTTESMQKLQDLGDKTGYESEEFQKMALSVAKGDKALAENITSTLKMATTAEDAATKVKTFSQLMDTLKEAAQSGWTQTWELLIGDFEQAKELFTGLSNFFSGIIEKSAKARNDIVKGVMEYNPMTQFSKKLEKVNEIVEKSTKKIDDLGKVADKVINGKFGNGQARVEALTKAGYDWATVQNEVNKKLGSSVRHATKATDAQKAQTKQTVELTDAKLKELGFTDDEVKLYRELEVQSKKTGKSIEELTKEMSSRSGRDLMIESFKNVGQGLVTIFKSIGEAWNNIFGTSDEVKILKIYNGLASINEATSKFAKLLQEDGDEARKIRETFEGLFAAIDLVRMVVGGGLSIAFKILKAVLSYFNMDLLDLTSLIGRGITAFRNWIKEHDLLTKAVTNLMPHIVNMISAIVNWVKTNKTLQKAIKSTKGHIQSAIKYVKDWVMSLDLLGEINGKVVPKITKAVEILQKWITTSETLKKAKGFISDFVKNAVSDIKNFITSFRDAESIPGHIIAGLKNGLMNGLPGIGKAALELAKKLLNTVKDFLGIHSPSIPFIAIGKFCIAGLVKGIQNGIPLVKKAASSIKDALLGAFSKFKGDGKGSIIDFGGAIDITGSFAKFKDTIGSALSKLNFGDVFAVAMTSGLLVTMYKFSDALQSFAAPFEGVGEVLESTSELIEKSTKNINKILSSSSKAIKSFSFALKAKAVKDIAISIAILAGSLALLVYVAKDEKSFDRALTGIVIMAGVLVGITYAISKMSDLSESLTRAGAKIAGVVSVILSIAASILLIAIAMKVLSTIEDDKMDKSIKCLTGIMKGMGVLVVVLIGVSKIPGAETELDKVGAMAIKMAAALLIIVYVMKLAGNLTSNEFWNGVKVMAAFTIMIGVLTAASYLAGDNVDKMGSMAIKLAVAMIGIIYVMKLAGKLEEDEIKKGTKFILAFSIFVTAMAIVSRIAGKNANKMGSSILLMSVAMLIMAGVVKLLGGMEPDAMNQGLQCIIVFGVIIAGLIFVTSLCKNPKKMGQTILAFAVAIAILAGVTILLGMMDPDKVGNGLGCVFALALIMAGLMYVAQYAKKSHKTIYAIAVAIAILAGSLILLSFIKPERLAAPLAAMAVLMGLFALILYTSKNAKKSMPAIVAMDAALVIMAVALYKLSELNPDNVLNSAEALGLVMVALAAAIWIISKTKVSASTIATIGMMALAVGVIGGVLYLLSKLPSDGSQYDGIKILALSLVALAIGLKLMNGSVKGAVAMLIVSAALAIFVPQLIKLSGLSLKEIGTALIALAGAFAIFGVAGLLLGPVVPALIGLAAAIALFGVGALAAGAGVLLLASGLQILENVGPKAIMMLQMALITLINMIPLFVKKVAEAIVQFITYMGQQAPLIAMSLVSIGMSIILTLRILIPAFANLIVTLIDKILATIDEHLPSILESGFSILITLLTGIRDNIGEITTLGIEIILEFINAIGEKIPDIIQAGIDLIFNLIEGIGMGIENNAERLRKVMISFCKHLINAFKDFFGIHSPSKLMADQGKNLIEGLKNGIHEFMSHPIDKLVELGKKLVEKLKNLLPDFKTKGNEILSNIKDGISDKASDLTNKISSIMGDAVKAIKDKKDEFLNAGKDLMRGLKEGIDNKVDSVMTSVGGLADSVITKTKGVFRINSPSKVFAEIGNYLDLGLIKGIDDYSVRVINSISDISESVSSVMSKTTDLMKTDTSFQPTITPVIDFDNVRASRNLQLGANVDTIITRPVRSMQSLIGDAQTEINKSNSKVIDAVSGLRDDLNKLYTTDDKELALYIDSRKMASALVNPMNRQLNVVAIREGGL